MARLEHNLDSKNPLYDRASGVSGDYYPRNDTNLPQANYIK
ncbi:hypothetical protein [uncultured Helicobacter sp.]